MSEPLELEEEGDVVRLQEDGGTGSTGTGLPVRLDRQRWTIGLRMYCTLYLTRYLICRSRCASTEDNRESAGLQE